PGKIHKVPGVVDDKMVDGLRLARSVGCLGQALAVRKHVQEGRLAYIGTSDESKFRLVGGGTFPHIHYTRNKFRLFDLHNARPETIRTQNSNYVSLGCVRDFFICRQMPHFSYISIWYIVFYRPHY